MTSLHRLEDLAALSAKELGRLFAQGECPDAEALVGWEYRGWNQPLVTKLGGFQKFRKGFHRRGSEVRGYNIPVAQNGLAGPWLAEPDDSAPKRFGFYSVTRVGAGDPEAKEPNSLLLNYSHGRNKLWEGSFLRDYLRRVHANNDELLLGKAYTSVAGKQIAPSYFILDRDRSGPRELDF